jgi:hypothetical protein
VLFINLCDCQVLLNIFIFVLKVTILQLHGLFTFKNIDHILLSMNRVWVYETLEVELIELTFEDIHKLGNVQFFNV